MQLQVELQKREEIMYLEANKEEKKISPKILGSCKVRKKVRLIISRLKDNMKGKRDVFSTYKQRSKVGFLVYLVC